MPAATLGYCLLVATIGQYTWYGGVIKMREWKSEGLWSVVIYCGGPENRKIYPRAIRYVYVDPKWKDRLTGRLLIDEMRELLKSREIVLVRFNRDKDGVCWAVAIEKDGVGMKLNLEESLP
jgi:hypothetical protein